MDYPDPDPDYDDASTEEVMYPDIDETVQYPWQNTQHTATDNSLDTSVLDPRLYRDSMLDISQYSDQQFYEEEYQGDEFQGQDGSTEDSSYELSGEENSTYAHK